MWVRLSLLSLIHFRLDLLWCKSVHQLDGLGDKLWVLFWSAGFADVYLLIVSVVFIIKGNAREALGREGQQMREIVMEIIPQEHQSRTSLSSPETQA